MTAARPWLVLSITLMGAVLIQGCVAVAAGGAVTGAAVAHDRRTAGTVIEDRAIEFKANQALRDNPELRAATNINITSYNLAVLVTGEAPTEAMRTQVIELIRAVDKVSHVYNEVVIAEPSSLAARSSDTLLTTKVKTRLFSIEGFDATRVKVVTERGVVYLLGLVSREEGEIATNATRTVGGVQKVVKLFEYLD